MRTDKEIIEKANEMKAYDLFNSGVADLVLRLPFEAAKPFLKDDAQADKWEVKPRDKESIVAEMLDYMPFAWDKANNGRGLSANRSMLHFTAWTWLAGDDFGDLTDYQYYGKDNLVAICRQYGWDHTQWDDGVRSNTEY